MTREEAIKRIRDFGLYHAISELPYSTKTVEAFEMAIEALAQPEPCEDAVSRNVIIQKLNTMDRYVSEELILCDTDKKFPKNEVFIVDDVYEEIVEKLPSAQPEIIHCKECKHRGEKTIADGRYWCELHNTFMYYCSDAERRTDECTD